MNYVAQIKDCRINKTSLLLDLLEAMIIFS